MNSLRSAISVCSAAFALATTAALVCMLAMNASDKAPEPGQPTGVSGWTVPAWIWIPLIVAIVALAVGLSISLRTRTARDVARLQAAIQGLATGNPDLSVDRLNFAEIRACVVELSQAAQRLQKERVRLSQDASRDPLTGLANRRPFVDTLAHETAFAKRTGWPLSLIMADLDHFKALNDKFGHKAGDLALCRTANRLSGLVRKSDTVARYGGEEFAIILPGTRLEQAKRIAQQARDGLRCDPMIHEGQSLPVLASFGVAELHECGLEDAAALISQADQALYEAKRAGRDTVVAARPCSRSERLRSSTQLSSAQGETPTSAATSGGSLDRDSLALIGSTFSILQVVPDHCRVARVVAQQVASVLPASRVALFLVRGPDRRLVSVAAEGWDSDDLEPSPALQEWASQLGSAAPFVSGRDLSGGAVVQECGPDAMRTVRIPLLVHGDLVGVMEATGVESRARSPRRHETILSALSAIGATALQRCDAAERTADHLCGLIEVLARTVHANDPFRRDHCRQVSALAVQLARAMGQNDVEELQVLRIASLVHDIGNSALPAKLLQKKGRLREPEWAHLREHSGLGAEIIEGVPGLERVARIVRHHHERYDGGGYPDGLSGSAIPLEGRLIAVADAYVAMISPRAHRAALSPAEAIEQIREEAGRRFDPDIVEVFLERVANSFADQHSAAAGLAATASWSGVG